MKTSILNIRVSTNTKDELEILSSLINQPISNIVRESIETYLDNYLSPLMNTNLSVNDINILRSLDFTDLIFWIYDKKRHPEINETDYFYEKLLKSIEKLNSHPFFTNEILIEFNKISCELKNYLYGSAYAIDNFRFPEIVAYQKLSDFMYALRYDFVNDKVIHI